MAFEPSAEQPIGVFDSGVGGLTVLHELLVDLPEEDYLYLGDTARFPYGKRSRDELAALAIDNADELLARGAKLLVIACNSATAAGLDAVRAHLAAKGSPVSVLGVVTPEAIQAVEATRNGRVGLLATEATVSSDAYGAAIRRIDDMIELTSVACPELASLIQSDEPITHEVLTLVRESCAPLIAADVDTVVLGCTHYPLLAPMFQRVLGRNTRIITSGVAIVRRVEHLLSLRGLRSQRQTEGEYRFLSTGDPAVFSALGTRFLQLPIGEVEQVALPAPADIGAPTAV
ncbi:MAG: glutamate racemase [Solirubrobacteraceae bacterium]|nr:glutamate racemase [Solirubrobacteraceae bacterium]